MSAPLPRTGKLTSLSHLPQGSLELPLLTVEVAADTAANHVLKANDTRCDSREFRNSRYARQ